MLWLVDGVRVNNRLYASTLPLDTLPAHMIERIEVLEGGQGLFYGTQAISGVINVITREFTDRTGGEVGLGFDDNDGKHVSAFLRGELGGNHLVLYGSVDDGDGYQPFRDQDYQASATDRKRGYDVRTGGIKFMRDLTENVRLSATYQHTDADIELLYPMWVNKNVNSRDEDLVSAKLDWKMSAERRSATLVGCARHDRGRRGTRACERPLAQLGVVRGRAVGWADAPSPWSLQPASALTLLIGIPELRMAAFAFLVEAT